MEPGDMFEKTLTIETPFGELDVDFTYDVDSDGGVLVESAIAIYDDGCGGSALDFIDCYPESCEDELREHAMEIERYDAIECGDCTAAEWDAAVRAFNV
jgi:hypothetical protein